MATRRPKLAFKGRDRHRIQLLLNAIGQVQRMDVHNANRATALGVPNVPFNRQGETNYAGLLEQIAARCTAALAQRVSQQGVPQG